MKLICDGAYFKKSDEMRLSVWKGDRYLELRARPGGTHHRAVYEAILAGLVFADRAGWSRLEISLLSSLVFSQITGSQACVNDDLRVYLSEVQAMTSLKQVDWTFAKLPFELDGRLVKRSRDFRRYSDVADTFFGDRGRYRNPISRTPLLRMGRMTVSTHS